MKNILLAALFTISCGPDDSDLPRDFSWADIDLNRDGEGENYITGIKFQPCGDCYIYAALALVEARWQIDHQSAVALNLSEQNIHNCLRIGCDSAGNEDGILDYIRDYGVLLEEDSPTGIWRPSCENCGNFITSDKGTFAIENTPYYRIRGHKYSELPKNYEERKSVLMHALQKGPVAIGIGSYYGYRYFGKTLFCQKREPSGHEVLLVGYKNYGEIFIIKNSWGEGRLLEVIFEGGEKCGFADDMNELEPDSVYIDWGGGRSFCHSASDIDKDNIPDVYDNCPWVWNPDQENTENDMLGDACDPCPRDSDPKDGFYCDKTTNPAAQFQGVFLNTQALTK